MTDKFFELHDDVPQVDLRPGDRITQYRDPKSSLGWQTPHNDRLSWTVDRVERDNAVYGTGVGMIYAASGQYLSKIIRPMPGFLVLRAEEIETGDVLQAFCFHGGRPTREMRWYKDWRGDVLTVQGSKIVHGKNDDAFADTDSTDLWIVVARGTASVASVVVGTDSPWNGKCPSCGKGTYTGLFDVKHDGPCRV